MIVTKNSLEKIKKARSKQKTEAKQFRLEDFLFKEQLDFVKDPAPNKVAMCSRRSGKTISCAADLIYTAISSPGVVCLYITLSRGNAKRIIWKELKKINKQYELKGKVSESELCITFPNEESTIYLSGAKDIGEIEKFRGMALKKVYIDEVQSFRSYVKDLVNEALGPTLMDYAGTLCLIGTPPPVPNGYFIETYQSTNTNWSKHHWTFFNNPFLLKKSGLTHQEMLNRELARRGVTMDDPAIQREFFGRCVVDTNSLILNYNKAKNDYAELPSHPKKKLTYILGVDIGHDDADALAVLAWGEHDPNIYLVEESVNRKQDITDLMNSIESMRRKYDISKIVIDTGGLGKKITEELIRRYQIPLQPADKVRKMENIALLDTFLRTGRFKAKPNSQFAQDCFLVEIDRDKTTADKIKISDRYHSDIIDAVLYAFKESYAYAYTAPPAKPIPGTKEWADSQNDELWDSALEYFKEVEDQQRRFNGDFS